MFVVASFGCPAPYEEAIRSRLDARPVANAEAERHISLVYCNNAENWQLLSDLVSEGQSVIVAVIPDLDVPNYVRAISAGADGVVYVDTPSETTVDVIVAAVHGEILLPQQAARSMAALAQREVPDSSLSVRESALLAALADGMTVGQLAAREHYSERTVRRHLQSLYLKLGVGTRSEAIALAAKRGLLR